VRACMRVRECLLCVCVCVCVCMCVCCFSACISTRVSVRYGCACARECVYICVSNCAFFRVWSQQARSLTHSSQVVKPSFVNPIFATSPEGSVTDFINKPRINPLFDGASHDPESGVVNRNPPAATEDKGNGYLEMQELGLDEEPFSAGPGSNAGPVRDRSQWPSLVLDEAEQPEDRV
jgi:hypothetical protein